MRLGVAALLVFTLGGCAEVTTFRRPDGATYYHVNCGDTLKLESCRHAAERTCPNVYARLNLTIANDPSPAQTCASGNEQRRQNGEQELACPPETRKDNFFVCK